MEYIWRLVAENAESRFFARWCLRLAVGAIEVSVFKQAEGELQNSKRLYLEGRGRLSQTSSDLTT